MLSGEPGKRISQILSLSASYKWFVIRGLPELGALKSISMYSVPLMGFSSFLPKYINSAI